MVAIFTGSGTGLERGSGNVLGNSGLLGSASFGRGGEQLFLNAATGNLLVQHRDEFLTGRGGDIGIGRTYNSLGNMSDENGDNWRQSTDRAVFGLSGIVNSWGSTIKRRSADGSEINYGWNGSAYVATDGAGAFDTLTWGSGNNWTWTDGDSRTSEVYGFHNGDWRIVSEQDTSGNVISYSYTGDHLTQIATADGGTIQYIWSGDAITGIVTSSQGATLTRTRYGYDATGRLSTVTVDLSPEDNDITDGRTYTTTYGYEGTSLLVASIAQSDGSRVDLQYDSNQRIVSISEKIDETTSRTSTLAYGQGYTTVTDAAGQTTRLDYGTDDNFAVPLAAWASSNVVQEPTVFAGQAGMRYTVLAPGISAEASQAFTAAAGETVSFALTLLSESGTTKQDLGIYGDVDGWSTNDGSSARIVSGPGRVVQLGGGLWRVIELSSTEPTRIQITRTFKQAQAASARFLVDGADGFRAGASLAVADPVLIRSMTADLGQKDIGTWSTVDLDTVSAGTIDGAPAYRFTISGDAEQPAISTQFSVEAGETYSFSISMMAASPHPSSKHKIGLSGSLNGPVVSSFRTVSGFGNAIITGNPVYVEGLRTTEPTRFEFLVTFDRAQTMTISLSPDMGTGPSRGVSVIAGAPLITRRLPDSVNPGQLLRITAPPTSAGAPSQIVQFGYDSAGNVSSITDAMGQDTKYVYDGAGNVVRLTDRLGNTVTRTYNAANQILTETRTGSDKTSSNAPHTTRYVYDSLNRLVYVVTPEGRVSRNEYDAAGQLVLVSDFPDYLYPASGLPSGTALSQAQLDSWCASLPETASAEVTQIFYDARGNITQRLRASQNDSYLALNPAGGYSDERFTYDAAGQLLSRYVVGNNTETFVYDGLGRVTASTDVNGGTTSFVFNDPATQTVVTLANGFVQTSTYSKTGELLSFTESGAHTTVGTASYKYDPLGRLRMMTDASGIKSYYLYDEVGRKIADINEAGGVAEYRYDADNRLVATARYFNGVNGGAATLALLADPNSDVEMAAIRPAEHSFDLWTWSVYDKEGRTVAAIDGDGSTTTYGYDASGRLVSTMGHFNKFSAAQIASFKAKTPTEVLPLGFDARDSVARIFYDKDGRTIGTLDGAGYLTQTIYDAAGRKVQEIAYATPTNVSPPNSDTFQTRLDSISSAGSANDRSTRYVYDGQGLLRYQIDGLNDVTEFGYGSGAEANGPVRQTTVYAGVIAPLSAYTYAAVKSAVTGLAGDAANRVSFGVYDEAGRLAYSIDAVGAVVSYRYDNLGQLIRKIEHRMLRPAGPLPSKADMDGWVANNPSNSDRVTRYFYNARGELRFTVDAENYVTRIDYDAEGRKVWEGRWDTPVALTDASTIDDLNVTAGWVDYTSKSWSYDPAGRLMAEYNGEGERTDYAYWATGQLAYQTVGAGTPDASVTLYVYDAAGRVAAEYDGYGGAVEEAATFFTYDGLGNLLSTVDANNHTTSWSYDKLGRKLSETNAAGGVTAWEYDAFGDVVRTTDARGNSSWSYYDQLGRVVITRDAEDYVTETGYTAFSEIAWVKRSYNKATTPAGTGTVPGGYDAHALDALMQFSYDKLGRTVEVTDAEGYTEYTSYDAFGSVSQKRDKLGGYIQYQHDRRGLVLAEQVFTVWGTPAQNFASIHRNVFEYDSRGNLMHRAEASGRPEQRDTWFAYDKADRLVLKTGNDVAVGQAGTMATPAEHYAYDERGNLAETWDAAGAHSWFYYDELGRKTAEIVAVTASAGTQRSFSYDAVGNLMSNRVYAEWAALPAAAGGQAPLPPTGSYRETTYAYDNINRLLASSVADQAVGYWNTGSYNYATATLTTAYEYDAAGNLVKTIDPAGGGVYRYYDRRGNKTAEVDAGGYATTWEYDAEGNVLTERRYATQASDVNVNGFTASTTAADRVTAFTYDRMGNRLTETRLGVEAWVLNPVDGQIAAAPTEATITYTYNALGQVLTKREANLELTAIYSYDSRGRLLSENRASFVDFYGDTVTPTVRYYYDALDNLVRSEVGGISTSGADRVTQNIYGAGGRLIRTIDAAGNTREFLYDVAGRKTGEFYTRDLGRDLSESGGFVTEGLSFEYDLAGNVTRQAINTIGSSWNELSSQSFAFNAFGELVHRGTNVSAGSDANGWQEHFAYDGSGRLIRSNADDGIWRHYVYDAAGRQSLVVESQTLNLAGMSQADAVAYAATGEAASTATAYDPRGRAVQTIQRLRTTSLAGPLQDIAVHREYNAFGELALEQDAIGYQTNYTYNTMGRVTQIERPGVAFYMADGTGSSIRPTERFFYDRAGRLIATQDANSVFVESQGGVGYKTTRELLAGTGYGESEAMIAREWHPDGGLATNGYDVFGDLVYHRDEVGRATSMAYDRLGRLVLQNNPAGRSEYFAYDLHGNRIGHWNNAVGNSGRERTEYDALGRITLQVSYGGDWIATSYTWEAGLTTAGMGVFGGWLGTNSYVNGLSSQERTDIFGHETWASDMGNHVTTNTFDAGARITDKSVTDGFSTSAIRYWWLSTNQIGRVIVGVNDAVQDWTNYSYDLVGNRLSEELVHMVGGAATMVSSQTATYDGLRRLVTWAAAATDTTPSANTFYMYDANSNIRRTISNFRRLDANGGVASTDGQDYWYLYDNMNRVVTAKGVMVNGVIQRGMQGVDLRYDAAGQRKQAITSFTDYGQVLVEVWDPNMPIGTGEPTYEYQNVAYEGERREDYNYWDDGQLRDVRVARTTANDAGGYLETTPPPAIGIRKADYWYDPQGRLERQIDYKDDPDIDGDVALNSALYDKLLKYNAKGQITEDIVFQRFGSLVQYTNTQNSYGEGAAYALGAVTESSTYVWRSDVPHSNSTVSNTYQWFDGAVLSTTTMIGTNVGTTQYNYDVYGQLKTAVIDDGRDRTVLFTNDANGQVIRRDEVETATQSPANQPHEVWYRFGGAEMGYTGNNGTLETGYEASVASRPLNQGPGAFRSGSTISQSHADFDQFYNPITSYEQGGAGGSYTVRSGDSLSSIAAQLWGDSNLWYRLADANGLSANSALAEGQRLTIPGGVMRSTYNASTFTPYDPAAALGDTSPTAPTPQAPRKAKSKGCGVFGQILLVVVAIAVTVATQGALAGALGSPVLGGAAAGVAGSVASQGLGLATGIQNKFNFGAVAMAGIAGGIGGGLGSVRGLETVAGSKFVGDVARGVIGSALTQGVGVATGLQSKFDFVGVAVAGVAAGAANAMGSLIDTPTTRSGAFRYNLALRTASGLAGAATRSVIDGTDFGDNLLAVLPDVIGQTIGSLMAENVAGRGGSKRTGKPINLLEEVKDGSFSGPNAGYDPLPGPYDGLQALFDGFPGGGQLVNASYQDVPEPVPSDEPGMTSAGADDPEAEIVVTGQRMTEQQKLEYDRKHGGLFWHLGNIFSGRNWDGSKNKAYEARAQAELATSNSVIGILRGVDKAATQTKLSSRFYYLQNPPMSIFDYQLEKPRIGVAQVNVKGALLGAAEVAALVPALRAGKTVEGIFELTEGVAVNGRRVIDLASSYENGIRGMYGGASLEARKFNAIVNGERVSGIADDITDINGVRTAIDAKYVDDWAASPRNPASAMGKMSWGIEEQQAMIAQAQKYSAGFRGGAIYHTNSTELATYYASAFKNAGIKNVRFIITPAIR